MINLEPREVRLPQRLVPTVRPVEPSSALDEAFASVTDADLRMDDSHEPSPPATGNAETADLAELVRQQLQGLKLQQANLTALLNSLSE